MDFPTDPKAKRVLLAQMEAFAPELLADINALRKQFPGARLTYFQAGPIEVGETPAEGVAPCITPPPAKKTVEQIEQARRTARDLNRKKARAKR
jgi:hypothetical protein